MNINSPLFSRRIFMNRGVQLLSAAGSLPLFLDRAAACMAADAAANPAGAGRPDHRVLVVVQLAGGNDGLNTIVPVRSDDYYKARPNLAVSRESALKLTDEFSAHPSCTGFKSLYDAGELAIVHAVAYPNANRSHFRATDIWTTAEPDRLGTSGWLGRYCDAACAGADPGATANSPAMGLALDSEPPPALSGEKYRPLTFGAGRGNGRNRGGGSTDGNLMAALNGAESMDSAKSKTSAANVEQFIQRTALDARIWSEKINKILGPQPQPQFQGRIARGGPNGPFQQSLRQVATLIASDMPTRIYYVRLGGFDTHANQAANHPVLLQQLSDGIAEFVSATKKTGDFNRVTLMTFSEFGRRVNENGSGTDHGEAAPMFLTGGKIKPGFFGTFPSLAPANLSRGDVPFTTDFRSVYATILRDWMKADDGKILGGAFKPMELVKQV